MADTSDYQELNTAIIPTKTQGIGHLQSGDHSYANFQVKKIEYNKPELF